MSDFRQPGPPVWRRLDSVTPQTVQPAEHADAREDVRYEAVRSRDARFDGAFFFAVETTGIYCRPSCPAVTPKRRNVRFFATAAAAQGSGFRACRRCRPDAVPGSADWNVRADVVGRAMRLIGDGVVDREGVAGLAGRLGYSARQVQRQLTAEVGAGPVALARAQRAHTARVLLQTTVLPVTEIAFASGFASVRQFNDTIRAVYAATPSELRAAAPARDRAARRTATPSAGVPLRLAHRGPYQAGPVFDLLQREAVTGVEEVSGETGRRLYRRTLRLPYGTGIVAVQERPGRAGTGSGGWLEARLHLTDLRDLTTSVQRLRRLFDLDADPYAVDERLGADPRLAPWSPPAPGCAHRAPPTPRNWRCAPWWGAPRPSGSSSGTARRSTRPAAPSPTSSPNRTSSPGPRRTAPRARSPPPSPTAPYAWTPAPTGTTPSARCSPCPAWTPVPSPSCAPAPSATRTSPRPAPPSPTPGAPGARTH